MRNYPTTFQKKAAWNALMGVSLAMSGGLVVGAVWLIGRVLVFLQPVLVPLAMAGIIAYLLDPVVNWLQRRGISRTISVSAVLCSFITAGGLFVMAVGPPIYRQASELVQKRGELTAKASLVLEQFLSNPAIDHWLDKWSSKIGEPHTDSEGIDLESNREAEPKEKSVATGQAELSTAAGKNSQKQVVPAASGEEKSKPQNHLEKPATGTEKLISLLEQNSDQVSKTVFKWFSQSSLAILSFVWFILSLAMVPIYLFYFLKESAAIRDNWHDYIPLRASRFKDEVVGTLKDINGYLIAFFRGQLLVSMIDGTLTGIALKIMGVPYSLVIGVSLAVLGVIPYVGIILTFIPAALIAYLKWHDWQHVAIVGAIFFVIQQFDGWFIQPKIVGNAVGLHPMTVIFSVLFWSLTLGGLIGALLAVPLTAAVKVLFIRYIWEKRLVDAISSDSRPPPDPDDSPPNGENGGITDGVTLAS